MHGNERVVGTVEGTGSAINVSCGFIPRVVELKNVDGLAELWWDENLPDGYGLKRITAGTLSKITSNGITPYDGSTTEAAGFTIGADTDVNVSGETIDYIAYR